MSLLGRFFYRRPPDGLLEFVDRIYVFDSCFSTEVLPEEMYQIYLYEIIMELYEEFPDSSFLAFNFREGEKRSQFAEILCQYDVTVLDYPRQYEGCPLLPISIIQHFLRVCESWLSKGNQQNVILLHCERGAWPLLAFLLASLLIFRRLHSGERRTLEMVHKEAPKRFLQLLSPLNPLPSQLRYLQYVARRNISQEWPPPERAISLDCLILRAIPNFDSQKGCRPLIRIFGRNIHSRGGPSTQMLYSMQKKKTLRHYHQADCDVIKIDIQCLIQGDVVLECVHLDIEPEREVMMFRIMFNTAFIRSNILILNSDNLDLLWDSKDRYPKGFRAEVLFGEVESISPPKAPTNVLNGEEKGGLPMEAFSRVQELFSDVELVDGGDDVALWFLRQLSVLSDAKDYSRMQNKSSLYLSPVDSEDENNASSADSSDEAFDVPKFVADPSTVTPETIDSVNTAVESDARDCITPIATPSEQASTECSPSAFKEKSALPSEDTTNSLSSLSPPPTLALQDQPPPPLPLLSIDTAAQLAPHDTSREPLIQSTSTYNGDPATSLDSLLTTAISAKSKGNPPQPSSPPPLNFSSKAAPPCPPPPPPPPFSSSITAGVTLSVPLPSPPLPPKLLHSGSIPTATSVQGVIHPPPPAPCSQSTKTASRISTPPPPLPPVTDRTAARPFQSPPPPPPPPLPNHTISTTSAPPPPPPAVGGTGPPRPPPLNHTASTTSAPAPPPPPPTPTIGYTVPPRPPPPPPTVGSTGPPRPPPPPPTVGTTGPPRPPPPPPTVGTTGPPRPPPPPPTVGTTGPPRPPPPPPTVGTTGPPRPPPPPPTVGSTGPPRPPPPPPIVGSTGPPRPPPPPPSGPLRTASAPPPPPPVAPSVSKGLDAMPPASTSVGRGRTYSGASLGRGRSSLGITNSPKKNSLKPLHWVKVTRAMQGSLWADSHKQDNQSRPPEIDISELESLFSATNNSDGLGNKGAGRLGSNINKPEKVQLVDLRRAYNCEIMLSKVKIPLPEMINAVLALDSAALDIDQVENLIKFCPTKEEMEKLKTYTGDTKMLGKCEQFFMELMKVPRIESKLRVFAFKITFSSQVIDLKSNLNTINAATREVKESLKLRQIMQTILTLGNALNQGTARGSAVGFKLDSLLKLSDTRARNNKMTLMHYLCKVLSDKMPELVDFDRDLVHLEAASKIQLKLLAEEMQAVSKGLEKVEQELATSENDGVVSAGFRKVLKNFLDTAEADVRSLISLYSEVGRSADSLSQYFGEDPARCPFEQVTQILVVFVRMFNKSREENSRQADAEKKKLEKEAIKERTATLATSKKDGSH